MYNTTRPDLNQRKSQNKLGQGMAETRSGNPMYRIFKIIQENNS